MDTLAIPDSVARNRRVETPLGDPRLAARLRREQRGKVLFGTADRGRYSTDASIYQVMPVGAVVPETIEDVLAIVAIAREFDVPLLPRGAGTSQCGQTVNRALVIDCTRHLTKVSFDAEARTVTAEPGVVLQQLNNGLKRHGLFFAPDPSTQARCTIGGMAANNSCGSKSIRYGLTADNVKAIDAILADGTRHRFGAPGVADRAAPARIRTLLETLRAIGDAEADEIVRRSPRQLRSVGGYNLTALTPAALASPGANLARVLVGSEGTLAFFASLELILHPIKPRKVLGICQFPTFRAAVEAVRGLVALEPEAVELVDRTMIELGRGIDIYRGTIDRIVADGSDCVLIVEFHGHDDAALATQLDRLEEAMADLGHPRAVVRATDAAFQAKIAEVREAGLNIMMSMKGDGKPVSFIEDCAVDLEDLADYTERLDDVFRRHGTKATWYAHASVGCLHVRPVLNMKSDVDTATMRAIAEACFALVREYKGSHSGEHGDGIVRSEFLEPMLGSRMVRSFEAVKAAFDPGTLLNPNRIVHPPRMDDRALFRYGPAYGAAPGFRPALDWTGWPGPVGGLLGAVEMCNNNGTCRKFDAGSMCPSFRVTRDEAHLTRGRANTLRLALTGQLGPDAMAGDDVAEAMKLCVSCKACRRECPTGIDMAKMKIEALAARAGRHGVGLRERLVAEMPRYAPLASRVAPLGNLRNRSSVLRHLSERLVGFAASRDLPAFRRDVFRDREADAPEAPRGDVLLLADTFNRYLEPENLRAAIRVLRAAGYRAVVAKARGRPLCCGRTYLAAGLVERARGEARRTLAALGGDRPVVGLEPSCLLTLRDEFRSLVPGSRSDDVAERAMLIGEFLSRTKASLSLRPTKRVAHVHGHCHQKSFGAFPDMLGALEQVPDLTVRPITSSCCGMAGAFGYQAETQAESRAMAMASLVPHLRDADAGDLVVADGTSCRQQIKTFADRDAVHSVRLLDGALA